MSSSARYSESPRGAVELEQRLEQLIGAVLSSRRTASGIAQRLAGESRPLQDFVLHWTGVAAKSSPELAYQQPDRQGQAAFFIVPDIQDGIL